MAGIVRDGEAAVVRRVASRHLAGSGDAAARARPLFQLAAASRPAWHKARSAGGFVLRGEPGCWREGAAWLDAGGG